ncbi:hypothetical protein [Reichenbachiella ulvae]|uniref:Uncharacterized protein n=1 Tax=Reichenbachiella ulvae TaxID=2980104 RepID=A0ABT3CWQ8_9BACT|nr:hypothetical protein [Reichenbachiella ulvae]MCV9387915.1 hypothetical protein [Reichenbachiella ulvae]
MGAGIGFVKSGQQSANQNRDYLKNRSNFSQKGPGSSRTKLTFKEASPEELEARRVKLREQKHKAIKKQIFLGILLSLVLLGLIWYLLS